jgi:hypothetical protein
MLDRTVHKMVHTMHLRLPRIALRAETRTVRKPSFKPRRLATMQPVVHDAIYRVKHHSAFQVVLIAGIKKPRLTDRMTVPSVPSAEQRFVFPVFNRAVHEMKHAMNLRVSSISPRQEVRAVRKPAFERRRHPPKDKMPQHTVDRAN